MSQAQAIYKTKADALPKSADLALRYRRVLRELRELTQSCTEIAEDRDRMTIELERLTETNKRLRKELEALRGEKA